MRALRTLMCPRHWLTGVNPALTVRSTHGGERGRRTKTGSSLGTRHQRRSRRTERSTGHRLGGCCPSSEPWDVGDTFLRAGQARSCDLSLPVNCRPDGYPPSSSSQPHVQGRRDTQTAPQRLRRLGDHRHYAASQRRSDAALMLIVRRSAAAAAADAGEALRRLSAVFMSCCLQRRAFSWLHVEPLRPFRPKCMRQLRKAAVPPSCRGQTVTRRIF